MIIWQKIFKNVILIILIKLLSIDRIVLFPQPLTPLITYNLPDWNLCDKLLREYNIKNDEMEFACAYFNYGVLAIIDKWVESDCEEEVSKIASLIIKLIGLWNWNSSNLYKCFVIDLGG